VSIQSVGSCIVFASHPTSADEPSLSARRQYVPVSYREEVARLPSRRSDDLEVNDDGGRYTNSSLVTCGEGGRGVVATNSLLRRYDCCKPRN